MKCEELLAALGEYIDGNIDPAICESLEEHLKDCNPCHIVVDNIRKTIQLYRAGERFELPAEFHQRLCQQLRQHWRSKFPSAEA